MLGRAWAGAFLTATETPDVLLSIMRLSEAWRMLRDAPTGTPAWAGSSQGATDCGAGAGAVGCADCDGLQYLVLVVDSAPEIRGDAIDPNKDFVQVPAPLEAVLQGRCPPAADLDGKHWSDPVPAQPDGLLVDVDPTLGQWGPDVAQGQRVTDVEHDRQADYLRRVVEIFERVIHRRRLPTGSPKANLV